MRLQAGLKAWTQVLRGQVEDKADVDMDTEAPQVSHKPGGEPKIKVIIERSGTILGNHEFQLKVFQNVSTRHNWLFFFNYYFFIPRMWSMS